MVIGKAAGVQATILDEIMYGVSVNKGNEEESLKETESLNVHWLQKLQGLCILWGTQISSRTVHIHTRQLASLPRGHQEIPAKFNFASDVINHWAGMEKVPDWALRSGEGTDGAPAVAETAVVRSPDPIRGEVVKAFVALAPQFLSHDLDELTKELQQHVKSVTAPYKYPRKMEFVLDLPKIITGKIQQVKLRVKEWKRSGQIGAQ
ncbi:LOW QUALITY PROTEIN: acyl-coenzyme A synthetase ACSM2A, mitochondrial [Balaenoptera acutorostrata]|uniref:LOW QUALITY PROTEIN: acyl-coenzyme A synthetase ACSM2A, mitochondrial n=1 Tax=Balaenoptera acutorostrata TaxID=9767 RepID=A0ABM3S4T6_BALAC|nr:LOW QUALITY PROTEIN: acyl-coenzyme A synthetase ACSM2A, mitochondrial [Balaenoptera acutorostrata]